MRTRDVLRWHWSLRDMLCLVGVVVAGAVLMALDGACEQLEEWLDDA